MDHPRLSAFAGPRDIVLATWRASVSDRVSLAAAVCAFWITIALFPAISALIATYGLVFNPSTVTAHLDLLSDLLPAPAFDLIHDRVMELVLQPGGKLSLHALMGIFLALTSAAAGTKSMLSALNVVYEVDEERGILRFQLIGLGLTFLAVIGGVLAIAGVVVLPAALAFMGLPPLGADLIHATSLLVLVTLFAASIALLYRVGPSRVWLPHMAIWPGAATATFLWLIASAALSYYISHLARFGATYGPIGAVVGIMLWFYVSAYASLLGAELNARLEKRVA